MKAVGVIPARWASTRFEGKMLALLNGQPLIEHVWRQAKKSRVLEEILIACDDQRIWDAAKSFGAKVVMTDKDHKSGTDRIAQAAADISADVIVNIQGDEPLIDPAVIDNLAKALLDNTNVVMATVIKPISRPEDLDNPNIVKTVIDCENNALYFSRFPIPYNREKKPFSDAVYYKHLGIYAYRKDFLLKFKNLPVSYLEEIEKLEQLRVLSAGYKIKTIQTQHETLGVDTPQDLVLAERMLKEKSTNG